MQPLAETSVPVKDAAAEITRRFGLPWIKEQAGEAEGTRWCRLAVAGYLLGCFLLPFDSLRLLWLAAAAPIAFATVDWGQTWPRSRGDTHQIFAGCYVMWMTLRSLAAYGMVDGAGGWVASSWLLGTLLLVAFAVLVWQAAENAELLELLGRWVGLAAGVAASASVLLFYVLLPGHVFGERLMNAFVYGGWNAVSTGLTFGFAAMWLECLREKAASRRQRFMWTCAIVLLLLAVCFTRSRGALLALFCGHLALTWARGLRRTWLPWSLLIGVMTLFILTGPVVNRVAKWQTDWRAVCDEMHEPVTSEWAHSPAPVTEMMHRGDSGRLDLYERALQGLASPEDWIIGLGQWGPAESCCRSLSRLQFHFHSVFVATLLHGGFIGLTLVLVVLGIALRRAIALARHGEDTWLVLLVLGLGGVLFDGHTLTSITSLPQFETLLVTFPAVAASAVWWHRHTRGSDVMRHAGGGATDRRPAGV